MRWEAPHHRKDVSAAKSGLPSIALAKEGLFAIALVASGAAKGG